MAFSRQTAYGQIADAIRADILAGTYEPSPDDPTRSELPGAANSAASTASATRPPLAQCNSSSPKGSSEVGPVCARWSCLALSGRTAGR